MIFGVHYLMWDKVDLFAFFLDVCEALEDGSHVFAIVHCCKAFDVFQDEHFWSFGLYIFQNVEEYGASSFFVMESLLFSCYAEGLAWKSGDVQVHVR